VATFAGIPVGALFGVAGFSLAATAGVLRAVELTPDLTQPYNKSLNNSWTQETQSYSP
jgi:hypothetical protein